MLSKIEVSYKTIGRLYSEAMLAYGAHSDAGKSLLNQPNITGDGTGYLLMVKKNFESYAQKLYGKG